MNAAIEPTGTGPVIHKPAAPGALKRFRLLLRRELWEHRGGIVWAPLIAGVLSTLLSMAVLIAGIWLAHRSVAEGGVIQHNGVIINGLDLGALAQHLDADDLQQIADGLMATLLMSASWPFMVMIFVAFFYCLGALYDDRKDRSVLFWKSLPVSDTATVLSKAATAIAVIPLCTSAIAVVTALLFLLMLGVAIAAHGGNPIALLWADGAFLRFTILTFALIPVYALWSLPTIGWLLMCSAWARSKPFLWAVLIPLGIGLASSMTGVLQLLGLERHWLWGNVISRLLLGTIPLTGSDLRALSQTLQTGTDPLALMTLKGYYSNFAEPSMWAGIIAGIVMIAVTIRLRRWREGD